jgi:hypothetical protein
VGRVFTLALAISVAGGCGYRLVRYAPAGAARPSVALASLRNDSFDPGLEAVVADALRREFLRRGAVRLVSDPARADLRVAGTVRPVATRTQSLSSVNLALEFELVLQLDLEVTRTSGESVEVDRRSLAESEFFLASADVEVTRKNRSEALRRVAGVLAGRVHDLLVEVAQR